VVKAFVCPSNPRRGSFENGYYLHSNVTKGVGPTDYVFSVGAIGHLTAQNPFVMRNDGAVWGFPPYMANSFGAFGVNSSGRIDGFKDGVSNTFLMGESVGGLRVALAPAGNRQRPIQADEQVEASVDSPLADQAWSQGHILGKAGGGYGSVFGATAWNAWYDAKRDLTDQSLWIPIPLNEAQATAARPTWMADSGRGVCMYGVKGGSAIPADLGSMQGFRGFHFAGVPFLMADGSVRMIREDVDSKLLVALSTPIGREEIPNDWQ
jgi:hypothetical protein